MNSEYFKTRCTRNEDGSYVLSYGKGGNKLEARLEYYPDKKRWSVGPFTEQQKNQCVELWGAWAKASYKSGAATAVDRASSEPGRATAVAGTAPVPTAPRDPGAEDTSNILTVILPGQPPEKYKSDGFEQTIGRPGIVNWTIRLNGDKAIKFIVGRDKLAAWVARASAFLGG